MQTSHRSPLLNAFAVFGVIIAAALYGVFSYTRQADPVGLREWLIEGIVGLIVWTFVGGLLGAIIAYAFFEEPSEWPSEVNQPEPPEPPGETTNQSDQTKR